MTRPNITPFLDGRDPERSLLAAVVYRAALDARKGRQDAARWLNSPAFVEIADILDMTSTARQRLRALAGEYQLGLPLGA